MKKIVILFVITLGLVHAVSAQNVVYAQQIIDTLTSNHFHGRGYVNKGDFLASRFIAQQFKEIGLQPLQQDDYYHKFKLDVNTFPKEVSIAANGKKLNTGGDFIVAPSCPTTQAIGLTVHFVTKEALMNKTTWKQLIRLDWNSNVLLIDTIKHDKKSQKKLDKLLKKYTNPISLQVQKKLTWSVARNQAAETKIFVLPGVLSGGEKLDITIDAKLIKDYASQNVIGYLEGSEQPDSFIFVTGHYDHLGRMGANCIMPGANDNASGIAMILDLAKHLKASGTRYSVVFIAFAGEEAGLVGSYHMVSDLRSFVNPAKIRFVVNMDLMGAGQEGIMAVNGSIFTREYALLESINEEKSYLPIVKKRGKAANSDHYFFSEAGIPAFFFYLMGPYNHYHDVDDTRENLRLEKQAYDGAFHLVRDFIFALSK